MSASCLAACPSLADVGLERSRRRGVLDPVRWGQERCREFYWSTQKAILESVRDNRRTAVKSCHGAGKSFIAARAAAWWIDSHPPGEAFVVSTAPTGSQVRAILWREINKAHVRGGLIGHVNQTEWWLNDEMVGMGRKPADYDPAAFQGIHARYVLVIVDEAGGVPRDIFNAADTLITNETSRILAIGNPDDPVSEFFDLCKPGSGWDVITISAFDTPAFTGELVPADLLDMLVSPTWVEEKRRKWGEGSPMWLSKVLGEFPENSQDSLIPLSWIRAAQERTLKPGEPSVLGVDVGGGHDKSVVCHRRGPVARIIRATQNPDTMQTTGQVIQDLASAKATVANVDYVGIGRGVVDRGREQGKPFVGVNVGEAARNAEAYANLRAEIFWGLRERFQAGDVDLDPDDDELAAQLSNLKFRATSRGQIQIESKDDMRRRGLPSPDRADALALAFAPDMSPQPWKSGAYV